MMDLERQPPHADDKAALTPPSRSRLARLFTGVAIVVVIARLALPLIAVPLIPVLLRDQLLTLIVLRPQKEFLLLAGARLRVAGEPSLAATFGAYVPAMMLAVWAFYVVGRHFAAAIAGGTPPKWLRWAVKPDRLDVAVRVVRAKGPWILVLGRLAAFPPIVLAAAAGVSQMSTRRYLIADTCGAIAAFGVTFGAGWALGRAYEQGGWWLTAAGLMLFVVLVVLLTRWFRQFDPAANDG